MTWAAAPGPPEPLPDDLLADELTTGDWVQAGVVLVVAFLVAALVRRLTVRQAAQGDADTGTARLAGRVLGYLVVAAGLVYALASLEVRIGPLLGALGIGGIALAFALQEILSNLVAGVLLQLRRPFHRGDEIETGDHAGVVLDVDLRVVKLRTYDGVEVFVPNSSVLANPIVNLTRTPTKRTTLAVGVAYDTDLARAQRTLVDSARGAEHVLHSPPPQAWVEAFGESSIDFALHFWHRADMATTWRARSATAMAVKAGLDEAGITIPFPQRTLWAGPGAWPVRGAEQPDG